MLIMLCENKLHFQARALTPFVCSNVVAVLFGPVAVSMWLQLLLPLLLLLFLLLPANCESSRKIQLCHWQANWLINFVKGFYHSGPWENCKSKIFLPLAIIAREKLFRHSALPCCCNTVIATIVITFSLRETHTQLCSILLLSQWLWLPLLRQLLACHLQPQQQHRPWPSNNTVMQNKIRFLCI